MPRRRSAIRQSDISRAIRAARREGLSEVTLKIGDATLVIKVEPSTSEESALEETGEIVL